MKIVTQLQSTPDADGFYGRVELDDGTEVALVPLALGRARITAGPPSHWTSYEEGW